MTCIRTDGAVLCGSRACETCGPAARAAAVAVEAEVNTAPPPPPDGPAVVKVVLAAFARSVEIEAPVPLREVSLMALTLWRQIDDPVNPVGATGFVMGEPAGPFPPDVPNRLEPACGRRGCAADVG